MKTTALGLTVPQGTCMIHGAYHGQCCPICVTQADPFIIAQPNVRILPSGTPTSALPHRLLVAA